MKTKKIETARKRAIYARRERTRWAKRDEETGAIPTAALIGKVDLNCHFSSTGRVGPTDEK